MADAALWGVTRRWITRGGWAVADQASFALSNFAVNVLLARWLSPVAFGAFVTSYSVFLLVSMIHAGIVTDPLVVFGAGRYTRWFSQYLRRVVHEHFVVTIIATVLMSVAAAVLWMLHRDIVATALFGMSCATPFLLLTAVTRRACYARSRPMWAAFGGLMNLAAVCAGLAVLKATGTLSVLSAEALMAASALVASMCVLVPLLRLTTVVVSAQDLAEVRPAHVRFGRWTAASGVLTWANTQGLYVWLAISVGLAETASLRATMNLVLPILHTDMAFASLLVPAFVVQRDNPERFRRVMQVAMTAFTMEAAAYGMVLVMLGPRVMQIMYGGAYAADPVLLWLVAGVPLVSSLFNALGAALKALEQPQRVFTGTLIGAAVLVTGGAAAAWQWGSAGAVAGMLAAMLLQVILLGRMLPRSAAEWRAAEPAFNGA